MPPYLGLAKGDCVNTPLIRIDGTLSKLIELMDQKEVTPTRLQALLESGLLSDVFGCNHPKDVDRIELQNILGTVIKEYKKGVEYSWFYYQVDYRPQPITIARSAGYDIKDLAALYLSIHTPPREKAEVIDVSFALVRVLKHISRADLEAELASSEKLRPPNTHEMLVFDQNHNEPRRNSGAKTSSLSSSEVFARDCGMEYLLTFSTKKNLMNTGGERYGEIGVAQIPRSDSMKEDMYFHMLLFVKT